MKESSSTHSIPLTFYSQSGARHIPTNSILRHTLIPPAILPPRIRELQPLLVHDKRLPSDRQLGPHAQLVRLVPGEEGRGKTRGQAMEGNVASSREVGVYRRCHDGWSRWVEGEVGRKSVSTGLPLMK